jgi:hypothetical protein
MLHLLYILAFTVIAFLAISNLIRSLITVSFNSQRRYSPNRQFPPGRRAIYPGGSQSSFHPELLDEKGQPINEPLLVMRSITVEDARQQLDNLYNSSPSQPQETEED